MPALIPNRRDNSASAQLRALGKELSDLGDGALMREAYKEIQRSTRGLRAEIQTNALATLPKHGGANLWVANAPVKTIGRLQERNAGVWITQRKRGHDLLAINRGVLRHPVFGNRNVWRDTNVEKGYFDKPIERRADEITNRIASAIDRLIAKGKAA